MPHNLDRLQELNLELTRLEQLIAKRDPDCIKYFVEGGVCLGFPLMYKAEIAVQEAFQSKGSVFPVHGHDEVETLHVYSGMLLVISEEASRHIGAGESVTFKPGQLHRVEALEDTWMVAVIVPASSAYPGGEDDAP